MQNKCKSCFYHTRFFFLCCMREVSELIPGHACRQSRSEFSVVFLWNCHKYGLGCIRNTPPEGIPLIVPGLTSGQLYLKPTINCVIWSEMLTVRTQKCQAHEQCHGNNDNSKHYISKLLSAMELPLSIKVQLSIFLPFTTS